MAYVFVCDNCGAVSGLADPELEDGAYGAIQEGRIDAPRKRHELCRRCYDAAHNGLVAGLHQGHMEAKKAGD